MEVQPKDPSDGHFKVSVVKSGLRITAVLLAFAQMFFAAGLFVIIAEVLGIVEELV